MKFTEQLIKRVSRRYWRGSEYKEWDKNKSPYRNIYITTSPVYAIRYSRENIQDSVEECKYLTSYRLVTPVDLFNARAIKDQRIFEDYCNKYGFKSLLRLTQLLKHEDWDEIFFDHQKTAFIKILEKLGYDGFTNIESIGGTIKHSEPDDFPLSDEWNDENLYGFSGIGILNPEKLILEKQFCGWDEIKKVPEVGQARKKSKNRIYKHMYKNPNDNVEDVFKFVWTKVQVHQLFTKEEIRQIIKDYDRDIMDKSIQEKLKKSKELDILLEKVLKQLSST